MKIAELMSRPVQACSQSDTLATAAQLMWEHDCGFLPVLDAAGGLVGTVTDRDVCMAAYTQGRRLSEMTVANIALKSVATVEEGARVEEAESVMRRHRVRRLPVTDGDGALVGIVSFGDLARQLVTVGKGRTNGLSAESVAQTMAAIVAPFGAPGARHRVASPERPSVDIDGATGPMNGVQLGSVFR